MRRLVPVLAFSVATVLAPRAWADGEEAPAPIEPALTPAPAAPLPAEEPAKTEPPVRPWRFTGTLGVVTAPRPFSLELLARRRASGDDRWDVFAVGLGADWLPKGIANFGSSKLSWLQLGLEGKWFPWRFLWAGARLGWQSVTSDSVKFDSAVAYTTTAFVFAPKIGALYTLSNGLTFAGELGVGIPIAPSTSLDSDGTTDSNGRKVAKTFGMFTMPTVSLFRVGYTF